MASLSAERYASAIFDVEDESELATACAASTGSRRRYAPTTRVSLDDDGFSVFSHMANVSVVRTSSAGIQKKKPTFLISNV